VITHARMKKFTVDNRVDKEGRPDPIIQLQVEMSFQEGVARDLASMTNGQMLVLALDPLQETIKFGDGKVVSTIKDAETRQLTPLEAGDDAGDDSLANTETQELIDRYQAIDDWFNDSEIQAVAGKDNKRELDEEAEAIQDELDSRGLYEFKDPSNGSIEWLKKGSTADKD